MSSTPVHPSAPAVASQHAMAILLADVEEAQRLAAALDEVRRPEGSLAVIAVPPVRALAFFADAERQEKLDRWWSHAIPANSQPVYLLRHQSGIAPWLPGLDGRFVIGVESPADAVVYAAMDNVTVAPGDRLLDLAVAAADMLGGTGIFRDDAVVRIQHRLGRTPARAPQRFRRARLRPADEVFQSGKAVTVTSNMHPIPNSPAPAASYARGPHPAHPVAADAGSDDLVRALAETLHRLQRIRSGA